jgi:uncharacterized cupredoxin-like copper-binding protein
MLDLVPPSRLTHLEVLLMKSTIALAALALATAITAQAQQPAAHRTGAPHAKAGASAAKVSTRRDGIRLVTVTANDYAFVAPDTIPAGLTDVRLLNKGTEMHHVWLIRLEAGKTMKDLFDAMGPHGALPAWARDVGGPNTPGPNGEAAAILRLVPGRYAMICVIPSPDGKPHVMKGMAKEVTVTPASSNTAKANIRINSTMTLVDYGFQFSQPLQAGKQTIRVRNAAKQGHEVVILKLAPGKKASDFFAWIEKMEGPPPAMPVGGTTPMAQGEENIITLDFTPGEYALICFVPDAKDGKPHVAHGMTTEITIAAAK